MCVFRFVLVHCIESLDIRGACQLHTVIVGHLKSKIYLRCLDVVYQAKDTES
jgi:hypothetical protein